MADKNYVKALRRAKAKKTFYTSVFLFVPLGFVLLISNIAFIAPNIPWSMFPIGIMSVLLAIQKILLIKKPAKTIFSRDYLAYQTEKELRLIEFEDDMDEIEAEKLQLGSLELEPLRRDLGEGLV
jgi:hypothetical protein